MEDKEKKVAEAIDASGASKVRRGHPGDEGYIKLNKCHSFAWSRSLWKEAAKATGRLAMVSPRAQERESMKRSAGR